MSARNWGRGVQPSTFDPTAGMGDYTMSPADRSYLVNAVSNYPADDLSTAMSELNAYGKTQFGPTGGSSWSSLIDTTATQYAGTIPASPSMLSSVLPWALGIGGFVLLLSALKGGGR